MNLHTCANLLKSLISFLEDKRNTFEEFEENAKNKDGVSKQYVSNKRIIKRTKFTDDTSTYTDVTELMSARVN